MPNSPSQICSTGDKSGDQAGQGRVVTVRRPSYDTFSATAPHTITPPVGAMCRCKAKAGLRRSQRGLHTRKRLSSLLRLNLDSSLKTTWFHSTAVQFPHAWHLSKRRRRWMIVKGSTRNDRMIPNNFQSGAFVWFEKTQGSLVKVLPVPGWRPLKQLAIRVHFLRCGGLLDDWSVEGVMSLVFV
ncbi:e3 ubiquitin-protein ligase RNF13 [Trichonephila clavipes]|nr:e3 ubiquitin-protein ligase RNF13 [Trichonephila clavipes]